MSFITTAVNMITDPFGMYHQKSNHPIKDQMRGKSLYENPKEKYNDELEEKEKEEERKEKYQCRICHDEIQLSKKYSKYIKILELGRGAFGQVLKVQSPSKDDYIIAKKIIEERPIELQYNYKIINLPTFPSDFIIEASNLKALQHHPNIIKLLGVDINIEHNTFILYEELADGTLSDYIKKNKMMDFYVIKLFMYQILRAVQFMTENNIWHRDLKPQNILLKRYPSFLNPGTEVICIKIADFGLSTSGPFDSRKLSDNVYTLWWRSPEILMKQLLEEKTLLPTPYNDKSEVWACGVILYNMLSQGTDIQSDLSKDDENDQLFAIIRKFDMSHDITIWKGYDIDVAYDYLTERLYRDYNKIIINTRTFEGRKNSLKEGLKHKYNLNSEDLNTTLNFLFRLCHIDPDERISALEAIKDSYFNTVRDKVETDFPIDKTPQPMDDHIKCIHYIETNWVKVASDLYLMKKDYEFSELSLSTAYHILKCYFKKVTRSYNIDQVCFASLYLASRYVDDYSNDMIYEVLQKDQNFRHIYDFNTIQDMWLKVGAQFHLQTSWSYFNQLTKEKDKVEESSILLSFIEIFAPTANFDEIAIFVNRLIYYGEFSDNNIKEEIRKNYQQQRIENIISDFQNVYNKHFIEKEREEQAIQTWQDKQRIEYQKKEQEREQAEQERVMQEKKHDN